MASRLESMTKELGRERVMSERFAELAGCKSELLGEFALKGIAGETAIYGLADEA